MKTWSALLREVNEEIKIMASLLIIEIALVTMCTSLALLCGYIAIWKPEQWPMFIFCLVSGCCMVGCCCELVNILDELYTERAEIEFYGEMVGWDK